MENSAKGITYGFTKPNAENKQNKEETPNETDNTNSVSKNSVKEDNDAKMNEPYIDHRSVTIALVMDHSLYRKANDKVLPRRRNCIGSSINSSKILSASKGEVEAYFPNIIGVSINDPSFVTRVKQYLNNISIPITELGKKFDISFHYNHAKDYYIFKQKEEAIEEIYQKAPRRNDKEIKEALTEKIRSINDLESTKYLYGYPVNVEDYLMYRHCLLYKDVAKDVALINSNSNIRFYFKDDQKEAERLNKFRRAVVDAKKNYVELLSDDSLFDAAYIMYAVNDNLSVVSALEEDKLEREIKLDTFSEQNPVKFNKICKNPDLRLNATIELLIARGELNRSEYNQNITTKDGDFVGANIIEAIAWFKNPANTSIVEAYKNRLKNI